MNSNLRNLLKGDRRAMSRLISDSEDFPEKATKILNSIFQYTGRAYIIGITGPPGWEKSTLVEKFALEIRKKWEKGRNNCHRSFIPIFWRSYYGK